MMSPIGSNSGLFFVPPVLTADNPAPQQNQSIVIKKMAVKTKLPLKVQNFNLTTYKVKQCLSHSVREVYTEGAASANNLKKL